ncbi:Zinc finger homeobox protein 3 [Amphibalanus amphitrite]|uniref:Zinc finger homeobox protein 3 n=1 Tax=Amphibalanus amphitrite TaxID=1232801 RepID=A0A6A4WFC1_AMPAM|nr:Zinc finger homeobox protein 3 [Amphibalanus amphitrite]
MLDQMQMLTQTKCWNPLKASRSFDKMDGLGLQTNGDAGSHFDGPDLDIARLRQLDPDIADDQPQAAHIRYQMQHLNPLLASQMAALGSPLSAFGLGDASAQSQQLMSLMAAQQLLNPSVLWAAQAQAMAQQQQQQAQAQQVQAPSSVESKTADGKRPADSSIPAGSDEKRARTRISGHQLKMLRAHFDVERTPSDETIRELGEQCGLAPKVVKHWFRNTLFKERQRDKDSPHTSSLPGSSSPPPAHNGGRPPGARPMSAFPTGSGWGAPVTREFGELSITLPSRSPFQQSPSPGSSSSTAYGSPMWSEISPPEGQKCSSRRANRTRFTDQQVKVLQDFFEKNAYPKEEDLRHLSKVLNLGPRVIVVWFQNARQKVRKVFENQPPPPEREEKSSRFQRTAELNYQCNRCKVVYQRYQELIRHQRQQCYREESSRQRGKSQEPRSEVGAGAAPALEVKPTPEDNTYKCGKCPQEFDRFDRWREHQVVHVMNPSVVPSSRQNQRSGSPAGSPSARPSHSAEEASDEETDDTTGWDRHSQDRRLRTSINPEQLQVLQRTYKLNSTPSRETLEMVARGTGLKKRVVQVWFQNARARERKSQAVRQLPVPVTFSGPTETVVKTKVTGAEAGT